MVGKILLRKDLMNEETVIKLALTAGLLNYMDNETPRHYFIDGNAGLGEVLEFSEMIINECISVLNKRFMGDGVLNREDMEVRRCIEDLKRHFGISENNMDCLTGLPEVNRVEVIDSQGRSYVKYGTHDVSYSLQDNGRTLKVFIYEGEIIPPCKTHPDAPHGFDRNASHSLDRYVCTCEHWEPEDEDHSNCI
jgi:hypothetical protein